MHHDTPKRCRVRDAFNDHHWSKSKISREFDIPRQTVQRILRYDQSPRRNKKRTGRPQKITDRDLRRLLILIRKNYEHRRLPYAQLAKECGLGCSGTTVRRALAGIGYYKCKACPKPFITESQRLKRRSWIREHVRWQQEDWDQVLWTDECTFETGKKAKDLVIRTKGERYCADCCQNRFRSGRTMVCIWGGIGKGFKTELVFLEGSGARGGMSMDDYQNQVLQGVCEPALEHMATIFDAPKLQEDGNRAHGLHNEGMQRWKAARGIRLLDNWPPSSPDFNPIEKVWRVLKQRIKHRPNVITTKAGLKQAIQEEWDRLDPSEWDKYINQMHARMVEGRKRGGLATSY